MVSKGSKVCSPPGFGYSKDVRKAILLSIFLNLGNPLWASRTLAKDYCKKELSRLRVKGLVAEPQTLVKNSDPQILESYKGFIKGRDTEILGQGTYSVVVREFAPQRRVVKIYAPTFEGEANLVRDQLKFKLLDKYRKERNADFEIPKVLGSDKNFLFLEDVAGIDHFKFRGSAKSDLTMIEKRDAHFMRVTKDLAANFPSFLQREGYTIGAVYWDRAQYRVGDEPPQLRMTFINRHDIHLYLTFKTTNSVFDPNNKKWIIDPN